MNSEKSLELLRNAVQEVAGAVPNGQQKTLRGTVHDVPPKILVPVLVNFYAVE
jgi:hypothetical protein